MQSIGNRQLAIGNDFIFSVFLRLGFVQVRNGVGDDKEALPLLPGGRAERRAE